jgi:hypothetical protein
MYGRIAQLVRAPRLHRGGQGFESLFAHTNTINIVNIGADRARSAFLLGSDTYDYYPCEIGRVVVDG